MQEATRTPPLSGGAFEHHNCSSACHVCLPCPGELRLANAGAVLPACLPGGSQSATSHHEVAQELGWHGPWLADVFRWVPVTAVAGHCREWCVWFSVCELVSRVFLSL